MDWFLQLVFDGDVAKVERKLRNAANVEYRDELLCRQNYQGFNAGRLAVERKNEEMLDMLLKYMTTFQLTNTSVSDGLSVIQRAVQVNPEWIAKFRFVATHANLLLSMVEIEDMDEEGKYHELWREFSTLKVNDAVLFLARGLKRGHIKLVLRMLDIYAPRISEEQFVFLTRLSIQQENFLFLGQSLHLLPRTASIFYDIVCSGSRLCMVLFWKSGRSLTKIDFFHLVSQDTVPLEIVEDVLTRGQYVECVRFPRTVSFDKFVMFLNAGFYVHFEKAMSRFTWPKSAEEPEVKDVMRLETLAAMQIRENLLFAQKKNLKFVCERQLLNVPEIIQGKIQHPYSKEHLKRIHATKNWVLGALLRLFSPRTNQSEGSSN